MTEIAAGTAGAVFLVIAVFQVALALGAPLGGMSWGGKHEGTLPFFLRVGSGVAAVLLGLAGLIVMARGGVLNWSPVPRDLLGVSTWVLAILMGLNTAGNVSSESRLERIVFGPASALLTLLCVIVAVAGNGPG